MNSKKYFYLNKISSPAAVKALGEKELVILADEVRDHMVHSVAKTGGHLASSLGTVELTISLFKVFDPPQDVITWDVGHQAYAHKIMTGRRRGFSSLRQKGGISGFLKRAESKYDAFGAGHSSTAVSAAMGFAKARDINGGNNQVIAVVGDASLANGMSLEAINHMGHDKTNVIIVVVDNEMSISPSVGAFSTYLNAIITGKAYNKFRDTVKAILDRIPKLGTPIANIVKHFEEALIGVFSPGTIFEELGFRYFGPINGHSIKHLTETLTRIKTIKGPKLLHVVTTKGKGYAPAEKDPVTFHGLGPFDAATGEQVKSSDNRPSFSTVFSETLTREAKGNKKIAAIVAAMIEGTNLNNFKKAFPSRFFDVGIAEEHAVTFAAGLAAAGMRPVVAIYSTFMQRSIDQVIHDIGLQKLPVIIAMDRAGLVGEDGPTHHGVFDIAFMKMIPNMTVMAPSTGLELRRMVRTACGLNNGPVSIRFPRGKAEEGCLDAGRMAMPIRVGKSKTLVSGRDITIVSLGSPLSDALAAAKTLLARGIKAEVIDARFAKPIDGRAILDSVRKTRKLITVEEGCVEGGFGQSILSLLAAKKINAKTAVLGVPDRFIQHGSMQELRAECGIDAKGIVKAAEEIL